MNTRVGGYTYVAPELDVIGLSIQAKANIPCGAWDFSEPGARITQPARCQEGRGAASPDPKGGGVT